MGRRPKKGSPSGSSADDRADRRRSLGHRRIVGLAAQEGIEHVEQVHAHGRETKGEAQIADNCMREPLSIIVKKRRRLQ